MATAGHHLPQHYFQILPTKLGHAYADTDYFRSRLGVKRWEEALGDHGYNATPVWNIAGSALANLAPASDAQLWWLTRIDPALVIAMLALIGWAFGWQGLCVALAVFATNFPSRFTWNGGAYLRWDFLFAMTVGPSLVGLMTDNLFHDPNKLHLSLSLTYAVLGPIAIAAFWLGMGPMRRAVAAAESAPA